MLLEVPKVYSIPVVHHLGITFPRSHRVLVTAKSLTRMRVTNEDGVESSLVSLNFYESIYVHV
jgi:hypothetical protein